MLLAPKLGVNQSKSISMALIHDIGESIIGDKVTEHGKSELSNLSQKVDSERNAILSIFDKTNDKEYINLFDEFMANKTPEAQFVRQLDKLEMALQAHEYELSQKVDMKEFYINAKKHISNPLLLQILNEIVL
jgi:putative hydrolase of HD superfamily